MNPRVTRLLTTVLCAATLSACGGGGGSGTTFKQTAYISQPQTCGGFTYTRMTLVGSTTTDYCSYIASPNDTAGFCPPNSGEKVAEMAILVSVPGAGPVDPIGPGTYTTGENLVVVGLQGDAEGSSYACPSTDDTSGTITITSVDETTVKGRYDIQIDGKTYSGTLDAPICWSGFESCIG